MFFITISLFLIFCLVLFIKKRITSFLLYVVDQSIYQKWQDKLSHSVKDKKEIRKHWTNKIINQSNFSVDIYEQPNRKFQNRFKYVRTRLFRITDFWIVSQLKKSLAFASECLYKKKVGTKRLIHFVGSLFLTI